jgi:hypothetical protein
MIGFDIIRVGGVLKDLTSHWNDVPREVADKQYVAHAKKVYPEEHVEVRTRKGIDFVAGTVKVRGEWVLVVAFVCTQINLPESGGASLGQSPKDDGDVEWEGGTQ